MPHGNAVGDRDGAELPRRAAGRRNALLDRLSLTHQRNVAWRRLVPAARNSDEGLMNLLVGEPHGVIVGSVRCTRLTLGHMPTGQPALEICVGVHGAYTEPERA